jgi:hypothetical protein
VVVSVTISPLYGVVLHSPPDATCSSVWGVVSGRPVDLDIRPVGSNNPPLETMVGSIFVYDVVVVVFTPCIALGTPEPYCTPFKNPAV